jgi:hypothetical protein
MRNNVELVSVNTPTNARVAPEYGRMVYRTGALNFVHDDQKKNRGKIEVLIKASRKLPR